MSTSQHVAYVDIETTGLDADLHEIWEVGLIVDEVEHHWFLLCDPGHADPRALEIGRFYERYPYHWDGPAGEGAEDLVGTVQFAEEFAALTRDRHLVGAVVSFDEERLRRLLKVSGGCPAWHYHIIDVEALAVGYLSGHGMKGTWTLPWNSKELSRAVGVAPELFDAHTALGDARWAKALYEAIVE